MARRAKHSREDLRDMAVAAAREIISEQGTAGFNMRAVAGRIGYSVGTLYNVFDNVHDLVANMNAHTLDGLYDALTAVPRSGAPRQDLKDLLRAYLRFIEQHRSSWNLLWETRLPDAPKLPDWYLAKVARIFEIAGDFMRPLFPEISDAEVGRLARLLWCGLHGIWSLEASDQLYIVTTEPADVLADRLINVFLAGAATQGFRAR